MTEEKTQVRKALVEAVTAQKLIETKLVKAQQDLALLKKQLDSAHSEQERQSFTRQVRQQELMIAEFEADKMAQHDLEKQLKATLFRLENSVKVEAPQKIDDIKETFATIDRMEGKVFRQEARAELSGRDNAQHKLKADTDKAAIEDQLKALKDSLKNEQD